MTCSYEFLFIFIFGIAVYVDKLMDLIFEEVFQDPALYTEEMQQIPVPQDLCAGFDQPDKLEIIAGYVSRFIGGLV